MSRTKGAKNKPKINPGVFDDKKVTDPGGNKVIPPRVIPPQIDPGEFSVASTVATTSTVNPDLPDDLKELAAYSDEDLIEFFAGIFYWGGNSWLLSHAKIDPTTKGPMQITLEEAKRLGKHGAKCFRYYIKIQLNPLWFLAGTTIFIFGTKVDFSTFKKKEEKKDEKSKDSGVVPGV